MSAYGWSIEYTISQPKPVLQMLYCAISKRKHEEFRMNAAIAGAKIETWDELMKKSSPSAQIKPEQEKMIMHELGRLVREKAGT